MPHYLAVTPDEVRAARIHVQAFETAGLEPDPYLVRVSMAQPRSRNRLRELAVRSAEGTGTVAPLGLTEREIEVLALIAAGRTSEQIASELRISPQAASVQVSKTLAKLGVIGRVEAAGVAAASGQPARAEGNDRSADLRTPIRQPGQDYLTGLPDGAVMLDLIEAALGQAAEGGPDTAVLFLDIDGFRTIKDSLGRKVGDALLREVAGRLLEQVGAGDVVGRLGGDQFLVLAPERDSAEAAALGFRLQTSFALPFPVAGVSVPLSASVGVAVAAAGSLDAGGLVGDAEAAMNAAKAAGPDRVHMFTPGMREAARWRLEVATRLRSGALEQLVVHYQPIVRLDTGDVETVEALIRWRHPERGLLLPDAFLAVAEETGQLIPITRWLLRETTQQAARWMTQGLRLQISVNISARHFAAETLVRDVRAALKQSNLTPEQLLLELTETSVSEDPTRVEEQLTALRGLGVRVAIDDFGTGGSSLARLLALPIGTLKIDRSLITAAERVGDPDTRAVVSAIVALTRTLGIQSVAEGVETEDHLDLVRSAGCDSAQGWILGGPMLPDAILAWVHDVRDMGGHPLISGARQSDLRRLTGRNKA